MNPTNIRLLGLGGAGKTTQIRNLIQKELCENSDSAHKVLYLVFNNKLRYEVLGKFPGLKNSIHTIHSFCLRVLIANGRTDLQDNLRLLSKSNENGKQAVFDRFIEEFLKIPLEQLRKLIPDLHLVCVDEYQEMRDDFFEVIRSLSILNPKTQFVFAGDPLQTIYGYQNKKSKYKLRNRLLTVEEDFGPKTETFALTKNHRIINPDILEFMNAFIGKSGIANEVEDLLRGFEIPPTLYQSRKGRKPELRVFTNRVDEYLSIKSQIKKYGKNHRIGILARNEWDLGLFEQKEFMQEMDAAFGTEERPDIRLSTIHQSRGREFDMVFIVGFHVDVRTDKQWANILYVAFTRAKKWLFVTSAYPLEEFKDALPLDYLTVHDSQRQIEKPYERLPSIDPNAPFTLKKLQKSTIDSIVIKVSENDAPFLPYVTGGQALERSFGLKKRRGEKHLADGMKWSIRYQGRDEHKSYYFYFLDLNMLKRNGFSDANILLYCTNQVKSYFDFRVKVETMSVQRIDLNKFIEVDAETNIPTIVPKEKPKSMYFVGEIGKEYLDVDQVTSCEIPEDRTLYFNYSKSKYDGVTVAAYNPERKKNGNRIAIPGIRKIEVRLRGNTLKRRYALGDLVGIDKLLSLSREGGLVKMRDTLLNRRIKVVLGRRVEMSFPGRVDSYSVGETVWKNTG